MAFHFDHARVWASSVSCMAWLVPIATTAQVQDAPVAFAVLERLAARAAIVDFVGAQAAARLRIVIDPALAPADHAPGTGGSRARPSARTDALARELGAVVLPSDSVVDCRARPCSLRAADLFVTLAEPVMSAREATVTVTILRQTRTRYGTQYRTVNVMLRDDAGMWRVTGIVELGIS